MNNVAPVAIPGGPYTADENYSITFSGNVYDPGLLDTHTYEWDLNNDGIYEITGQNTTFTWNDDYFGVIWLKVTDDDGGVGVANTSVTVNNVAPNVTEVNIGNANGAQDRLVEAKLNIKPPMSQSNVTVMFFEDGQPLYYNGTLVVLTEDNRTARFIHDKNKTYVAHYDVVMADPVINTWIDFFIVVDGNVDPNTKESTSHEIFKQENGTYQQRDVNVTDVLSNMDAPPGQLIYTFSVDVMDLGSDDLTFTWDFGDGSMDTKTYYNDEAAPDPYPSPYIGLVPFSIYHSFSHLYANKGTYTVSLSITDDDGGIVSESFVLYIVKANNN